MPERPVTEPCLTARALTTEMETVGARGQSWSAPQEIALDGAALLAAWRSSDDPFAMLLLLAARFRGGHVEICRALTEAVSFLPPMKLEAQRQARCLPGMHYDGPDRFRFLHLAQRVRGALRELDDAERGRTAPALCEAIRKVMPVPVISLT